MGEPVTPPGPTRLPDPETRKRSKLIETREFACEHKVRRIGRDEVWNPQTHPNCVEYDLFEIGRSHLGNPGVVVGSETRFLLKGVNVSPHFRHLVV
jgi:hypothetical protein